MEWISPNQGNILSEVEGNTIDRINIQIDDSNYYEITKVSGNFPNGIYLDKDNEGYFLTGILDLVEETTTYYFTLQAKDLDTEEFIQRWFSIEVITLNTMWDDNNKISFEEYEKTYFSYQFNLQNPEGNEVFKKVSGELPNGLNLSETGLLYGVPEEDRIKEYNFKIGIYRNNIKIIESPSIILNIKDLSTLNNPIWITSEGIISYINYGESKITSLVAYDPKGRTIYYEMGENNLPAELIFETDEHNINTSGNISGICKTKVAAEWSIEVRPFIYDENNTIIYGDWRLFKIVTNSQSENYKIDWITNELDNAKIGYPYSYKLETKSKYGVKYQIVSGNLPDGLIMDSNGNIFGITDFQEINDYSFIVRAYNDISFVIKEFTISVEKGLSENTVDVYLNINKENQQEYQRMISKYNSSSSYNPINPLYKINSFPKIDVGILNTWDNVLLKYKLSQFNTPIDIFWKETKKKSFENYDFFYKDFNEVNRYSEDWKLKLHSEYKEIIDNEDYIEHFSNETIEEDRYENKFRPGYIRESIDTNEIEIKYYELGNDKNPDSEELGEEITDIENIKEEVNEKRTNYYYVDPKTKEEYLIHDPVYYYQGNIISEKEFREIDNYIDYGNAYVLDDNNNKIYVTPIAMGRFYETVSKRIINLDETIYIVPDNGNYRRFILKYNEETKLNDEIEVSMIDKENQYCSFNPYKNIKNNFMFIDISKYGSIQYEEKIDNYYKFNSELINFKTTSINGLREVFTQQFNVEKYDGKLWYKISNQEIIKNESFDNNRYIIKYNKEEDYYYIEFDGVDTYVRVYKKMDDNSFKPVFANVGTSENPIYKPLLQKISTVSGHVDWTYYMVYPEGTEIPMTNALFITDFEWDKGSKYICELNDEGYYEWFKVEQIESPYVYYASNNSDYGYDKDIVLPYVLDENVKNGTVAFLNIEEESEILPEYSSTIEVNGEKKKYYTPLLPLFYGISRSQNAILQNINTYEKQGNYWYGKKFVFFELHFCPRYKKDIDKFTILFYNDINENTPGFLLI